MDDSDIDIILAQAKGSEHGVEIRTNDSELFQRKFYQRRNKLREQGDHTYNNLTLRTISPHLVFVINGEG